MIEQVPRTRFRIMQGNEMHWHGGDSPHAELDARARATQISAASKMPVLLHRYRGGEVKLIARYVGGKPAL